MRDAGWPIHKLDDGSIDYALYRAEAARQRAEAIRRFALTIWNVSTRKFTPHLRRGALLWP